MRLGSYTVYDTKAECFFPPFFARTNGEALRQFGQLLTDPQSRLSKFPADYRLYRNGEFDDESGVMLVQKEGILLLEDGLSLVEEAALAKEAASA